ncbi:unnamed protein product [Parnassius mnemosyne]|uniref:Reverse transcriptase domain-containing protein n=1 Tax=Parnassius mnemosyne TaxID=213953 RepID=A0AAV1KGL9_9NEOP
MKECYNKYINAIETDIKTNPKQFWTHIKNLRKNCSSYPNTMTVKHDTSSDTKLIADMFASHFSSIYERDLNDNNSINCDMCMINDVIGEIQFKPEDVKNKLKKLDITKGADPDNIHPLFLINCADALTFPLTFLYNRSLKMGIFPDEWKLARVVPIFKNGAKDLVVNYRPISILSAVSKVFESLVHSAIYRHTQKYIIENQHGFMSRRSTNTNLILFTSDIKEKVDQGLQVDAIYTDFSKAFDKVNHSILLHNYIYLGLQITYWNGVNLTF